MSRGTVAEEDGKTVLSIGMRGYREHLSDCHKLLDAGKIDEIRVLVHGKPVIKVLPYGPRTNRLQPGPFTF